MRRAALLAAVALASIAPSAAAHGGGGTGYRSAVTTITPATPGLTVRVLEDDDQLTLTNNTGKTVIVLGYENEPYLRIRARGGIDVNSLSPASTLNINRYGHVTLPPNADARAAPRWQRIGNDSSYTWHDHRIRWMSTIDPPAVRNARSSRHHIFNWVVPLRLDGTRVAVTGTLDYYPAPRQIRRLWYIALIVPALAGLLLLYRTATRSRHHRSKRSRGAS
ncbi:MAG: hypothetical protein QOD65_1780 [Gaiellales bacterium]|nr:hypothetical protein [Gaiellales bacterium]